MENTRDLSRFGYREVEEAGALIEVLAHREFASKKDEDWLHRGIAIEFNPSSGNVFLVDDDDNVAMLNDDGKLESFLSCSVCGDEGLRNEVEFADNYTCKECRKHEK